MAVQQFSVVIEWDAVDDTWITYVPALDHLSTYGETRQAALEHTREASNACSPDCGGWRGGVMA
ncbi:MAG: type II toxin-antitoxin system HicB family antitoxin [Pseudonocardiaceae bacterium]